MKAISSCLLAGAGLLVAASCAVAGPVPPLGPDESDVLTVFRPNGKVLNRVVALETLDPEGSNNLYLVGSPSQANPAKLGSPTVLFESNGSVSDIVGIAIVGNQQYLAFESDAENGPPLVDPKLPNEIRLQETAAPVDVTPYLSPAYQTAGYTAYFQSDVEAVPEPASLTLLGLGAVGLAGYARRSRQIV